MKLWHCLLLNLWLVSSVCAANSVVWGNAQANAAHTGYVAQTTTPTNFHILWKTDLAKSEIEPFSGFAAQPIVTDQAVYFAVNNWDGKDKYLLKALNLKSGASLWGLSLNAQPALNEPLLVNDQLYIMYQSVENGDVLLQGFQSTTGKLISSFKNNYATFSYPLAFADTIYFDGSFSLISVNPVSGLLNWQQNQDPQNYQSQHWGMAAADESHLYQITVHGLSVLDRATGNLLYSIDAGDYIAGAVAPCFPVLDMKRNNVYHIFRNGKGQLDLIAFDLNSRTVKWKAQNVVSNVVLVDDEIYVIAPNIAKMKWQLIALNADNGQINWSWMPAGNDNINPNQMPVATSDVIFVPGTKTFAISRASHQQVWSTDASGMLALGKDMLLITSSNKDALSVYAVALN